MKVYKTSESSLAFQYALKDMRKNRRTARKNCKVAKYTQPTFLDEYAEFRADLPSKTEKEESNHV